MQADPTKILSPTIDIRQNYFPVFESLSPKIGILDKQQVKNIVRFYALCRTAIDSTHADGVMIENDDVELALENVQQLIEILEEALRLGDAIVQFPTS